MTIRDLFVSLGFEVDAQSEKKVEATVRGLKQTAATALNAVNTEPLRAGAEKAAAAYKAVGQAVAVVGGEVRKQATDQKAVISIVDRAKATYQNMVSSVGQMAQGVREQLGLQQKLAPAVEKVKAGYAAACGVVDKLLKKVKKPATQKVGFKVDEQSRQKAEGAIKGLHSMATRLLGAIGIGFSLVNMNALAEEFNGVNDMIRNATRELGDQADIQQTILGAANEMKSGYAETAKIVSNLVQESPDLFGSVDEAANFATLTTKLFKSTGKSQEEINGLQEAINKSFAKGIVDSETINQLYEKAPEAINMISDSLGVAKENLAKMATDGTLKVADLKNAFVSHTDVINQKFDELDFSISDALLNIRNQWGYWLDQINSTTGFTKNLGKFMVQSFSKAIGWLNKLFDGFQRIAKMVGGYKNLFKIAAAAAAGIWLAMNGKKILDFLKSAKILLSAANLKIAAIAAAVIALFLIIDDIINFVQGNDSVIGKLFEKAGIDADKARQTILTAWNAIVGFLTKAWDFIRQTGEKIWGGLGRFWEEHGQAIKDRFLHIWNAISNFLGKAWNALCTLAEKVFNGLKAFWERWGAQICNQFTILWNFLASLIDPFLQVLQGIIDFITGVFTGNWTQAWEGIKAIFSGILDGISACFHAVWDTIHNWFGEKIDAIKETLVNGFNGAVEFMQSLPEKALQWGRDFIDGLVNGIKDKIGAVTEAVSSVGEKIKSFLHFSVPDEGPLTDYESWMPDFMAGLAEGIQKNSPMVIKAISALSDGIASVKDAMAQKLNIPQPAAMTELSSPDPASPNPTNPNIHKNSPPPVIPLPAPPKPVANPLSKVEKGDKMLAGFLHGLGKGRELVHGLIAELDGGLGKAASGFAAGLMDSARSAIPALKKLADTVAPLGDISVKGTTRAAVQGGGNRTTNVQQTNNITNKFEGGDRAAQVEGAKAMGKTEKDMTAQMARALATGR